MLSKALFLVKWPTFVFLYCFLCAGCLCALLFQNYFKSHLLFRSSKVSLYFITCDLTAAAFTSEGHAFTSYRECALTNHVAHLGSSMFLSTLPSLQSKSSGQWVCFNTLSNICSLDYPHLLLILSFSGAFLYSSLRKLSKVCIYPCRQLYTVYSNALRLYSWPGQGSTWPQQPCFLFPLLFLQPGK